MFVIFLLKESPNGTFFLLKKMKSINTKIYFSLETFFLDFHINVFGILSPIK